MKQRLFLFAAILLALISCSGDNDRDNETNGGGSSNKNELTVEVYIPVQDVVQTYALTAKDESNIDYVSVLMFNKADDKFIKQLRVTKIIDAADAIDGNKKQMNIEITEDGVYDNVYFLMLANCPVNDNPLLNTNSPHTLKEIMDGLSYKYSTNEQILGDKKWPIKPGRFVSFPMFGISQDIDLTKETITVPPITLTRSIAKIDVGVNFDTNHNPAIPRGIPTTDNTFKIESVIVCNAYDSYLVTPKSDNWDGTGVITEPSVPVSAATVGDLTYTWLPSERETSDKFGMLNRIYITEHEKAEPADDHENKVLYTIIGGYFTEKGKPENTDKITYYRVDFLKSTKDSNGVITEQTPLAILRNRLYRINIVKVQGEGYPTIEEAKKSIGNNNNMLVDVTNDDGTFNDIVYDGKYVLGIEQKFFSYDKRQSNHSTFTQVKTTHPQGWKAVVTEGEDWLHVCYTDRNAVPEVIRPTGTSNLLFYIDENTTLNDRTGRITITSGSMKQVLEVKQLEGEFISIIYPEGRNPDDDLPYLLNGREYSFYVKSRSNWTASIPDRYDNSLVTSFTPSGVASSEGTKFTFTLADDMLDLQIRETYFYFEFKCDDNSKNFTVATIHAASAYDLANLFVYPIDQPGPTISNPSTDYNWYVYSNTPDGIKDYLVPPEEGAAQSNPPRENSCASIKSGIPGKPWRLPTLDELQDIYTAVSTSAPGRDPYKYHGFPSIENQKGTPHYYYASTTYLLDGNNTYDKSNIVQFDGDTTPGLAVKPKSQACNWNHHARCVRDK